jgi:hypothetical protein
MIHFDANEGRYLELGCIYCQQTVECHIGMAAPVRMYVACFSCPDCMEQLIEFEI